MLLLIVGVGIPVTWAAINSPTQVAVKPAGDLIPAGMAKVTWSYPGYLPDTVIYGTLSSTDPVVIEKVRGIINALPVQHLAPGTACPADYMIPVLISFSRTTTRRPNITVSFQLGGCPAATVIRAGHSISPPLAGANLAHDLTRIEQLIHRGPPPVF